MKIRFFGILITVGCALVSGCATVEPCVGRYSELVMQHGGGTLVIRRNHTYTYKWETAAELPAGEGVLVNSDEEYGRWKIVDESIVFTCERSRQKRLSGEVRLSGRYRLDGTRLERAPENPREWLGFERGNPFESVRWDPNKED